MIEIIPAILQEEYSEIRDQLRIILPHTEMVQIDICDGVYVDPTTWPYVRPGDEAALADLADLSDDFSDDLNKIEFDGIQKTVIEDIDRYALISAKRHVIHLNSHDNIEALMQYIYESSEYSLGREIGIALRANPTVQDMEMLQVLLENKWVDYVQVMGIAKVGVQGQAFDPACLETIAEIRSKYDDIVIQVDGGMNAETIPQVLRVGVNRVVVGSAIWNTPDPVAVLSELRSIVI